MKSAVIGTGVICEQHLLGLEQVPDAELVAVCDLSPAMAEFTATRGGGAMPYTDYQEMLVEKKPDVVHVLTPPKSHPQIVSDCLSAGAHVLCEKPIALDRDDFKTLWEQAQAENRLLVEDHNYRFNRPIREIDRLVADGHLGEVGEVEVRMSLPVRAGGRYADENLPHPSHGLPAGVVHEFLTHLCYLGLHFCPGDRDYSRLAAAWSNHGHEGEGDPFKFDDLDATVLLGKTHLRIRFSAHLAPDCLSVTVRGSEGTAEAELFQPRVDVYRERGGGTQFDPLLNRAATGGRRLFGSATAFLDKVRQRTPYEGLHHLVGLTYDAVRSGGAPPVTYQEMDDVARLVEALLAEENRL